MLFPLLAVTATAADTAAHHIEPGLPPLWSIAPFVVLLLSIALMPLIAPHFWEHHYPKVAIGLGLLTGAYFYFVRNDTHALLHAGHEYVSFMALVGSLFVISGGINISVKGGATPAINTLFLAIGAILANVIGTTGASMLLIRPWIRMNKYRITGMHVVFFIFLVSNVGGCLTPIGDPPLFLGFLRGVPFWWIIEHCWSAWALACGLLLVVFYIMDKFNFRRAPKEIRDKETASEEWGFRGMTNLIWLGIVLGAVFLPKNIQETTLAGLFTIPALIMMAAAAASYFTTKREVHRANDFNFAPVKEVGYLFVGIFLTMIPALQNLQSGELIRITTPLQYYFATGILSAFLDNAPTYLSFLAAAMGAESLSVDKVGDVIRFTTEGASHLIAISLGAVFFGAGSYIGNGPNFMVKAIAEKARVKTPSFLVYIIRYSLPILVPILVVVGYITLRNSH